MKRVLIQFFRPAPWRSKASYVYAHNLEQSRTPPFWRCPSHCYSPGDCYAGGFTCQRC